MPEFPRYSDNSKKRDELAFPMYKKATDHGYYPGSSVLSTIFANDKDIEYYLSMLKKSMKKSIPFIDVLDSHAYLPVQAGFSYPSFELCLKGWDVICCNMSEGENWRGLMNMQNYLSGWNQEQFDSCFEELSKGISMCDFPNPSEDNKFRDKYGEFKYLEIYNMINGNFEKLHKIIQGNYDATFLCHEENVAICGRSESFHKLVSGLIWNNIFGNKLLISRFLHRTASELFANYGIFDRDLFALATEALDYYISEYPRDSEALLWRAALLKGGLYVKNDCLGKSDSEANKTYKKYTDFDFAKISAKLGTDN